MSLDIKHMAIHKLVRNTEEEVTLEVGSETTTITALEETLVDSLHKCMRNTKGRSFAYFDDKSFMKEQIDTLNQNPNDFSALSTNLADSFQSELVKYPFATDGFLVICKYQSLATDYMIVALIPHNTTLKVGENCELSSTAHIDVSKIDLISSIDLTTYEVDSGSNRYITIKNGRGNQKHHHFFLDMWEAELGLDSKAQNLVLMQAVDDFCSSSQLEKHESDEIRKSVSNYAKDVDGSGDEIVITELSGELPSTPEGLSFADFTKENGYELEETFPAKASELRKLTKFVGAGGGVNISFDSILLNERVFYNPETDTLTIKGTPPNMRDALNRRNIAAPLSTANN
ncbi:nucleoid-associated protein YejK [Vibrio sp. D431a]|uniref:nucleoid-associated protein YejK n=1 Tax=Vibrio sp. D431a TaxID=2837388 RepID=UPI0025558132|nr:nucleoid-associated protein YejK [Vibrio sp. D431a]MDK9790092.1 nucleoid-associated protein YejK [Vibrio sp. D431a]